MAAQLLLIEDDPLDVHQVRRYLAGSEPRGFEITHADTMERAVEHLETGGFDVVVTDLNLPDSCEQTTIARILEWVDEIPIIVLSGNDSLGAASSTLRLGVQDFLPKQELSEASLSRTIRHALERYQSKRELSWLANHDPVTGLQNRHYFNSRLQEAIAEARRDSRPLALALLDLDNFKDVNDGYGHDVGDELLRAITDRLRDCVRSNDVLARIGGDEFAILFSSFGTPGGLVTPLERIIEAASRPYQIRGYDIRSGCSIGVAFFPGDSSDPQGLLRSADMALYEAKARGRNTFSFFSPSLQQSVEDRVILSRDLRDCLDRGGRELSLVYQPIVELTTGTLVSVEALVRWRHAERGMVPPDIFIEAAEQTGLIQPLSEWILHRALDQAQHWRAKGHRVVVSLNVSPAHFRKGNATDLIVDGVLSHGAAEPLLSVEVTENTLMEESEASIRSLSRLKEAGINIAIDDFGTGYSSLSYLTKFPVDTLKIDRCFVRDALDSRSCRVVVEAVIGLAQSLGLTVVGEGIETPEQLAFLTEKGCQFGQGYYFSPGLPAEEVERWLSGDAAPRAVGA